MKYIEKHPLIMILIGIIGISLSSIFVKYSTAPSAVTATYRLLWTVALMTPVVLSKKAVVHEFFSVGTKTVILCCVSGLFLAMHFVLWFESLSLTTVASSTTIVCTEAIWVSLGYCLFMKGRLSKKAVLCIGITLIGSFLIAYSDALSMSNLFGDILALLAAIAVAVYMLIGRAVRKNTSTTVYTYIVYFACALALIVICTIQKISLFAYGTSPIIVGLLLAIFSTILGHSIFSWCLKYFSPSFVSASKLCEPVVAAILAGFLFGEIPTATCIAGGVLILGGNYYYSRIEQKESSK